MLFVYDRIPIVQFLGNFLTLSKSIEIDLFTQLFLISTTKAFLTRSTDTAEGELIKVSSTRAVYMLRTQETVAVEVSTTVVGVREEARTRAFEAVGAFNAVRRHATSSSKDLPHGTAVKRWKKNTHCSRCCHTDVIDVRIKRPRAHVTNVVACELIATANWIIEIKWTVVGDRVEGVVATAENIHSN